MIGKIGKIDMQDWKSFKDNDNQTYFSNNGNLGGILNVSWFQSCEKVQHYVCFIITILNLPRIISEQKI